MKQLSFLLILMYSVDISFSDAYDPAFFETCGPGVDWFVELEGVGHGTGGSWEYLTATQVTSNNKVMYSENLGWLNRPNPFIVDKQPDGYTWDDLSFNSSYIEHGDLMSRKFRFLYADDGHNEIFNEIYFTNEGTGLHKFKYTGVSEQSNMSVWGTDTYEITRNCTGCPFPAIDFSSNTDDLVNQLMLAQGNYLAKWGRDNGSFFRGVRRPSNLETLQVPINEFQGRKAVVSKAMEMTAANILYTVAEFDDMLDMCDFCGDPWSWDGNVNDIDALRCDGLSEFAYEDIGIKVWGPGLASNTNSLWNLGHQGNDWMDEHQDSFEHIDYSLNETSPMIQSGCGGYGDGNRSTMQSHDDEAAPYAYTYQYGDGSFYINISDGQSEQMHWTLQVQLFNSSEWRTVVPLTQSNTSSNGSYWTFLYWTGHYYIESQGWSTMNVNENYKYRLVVIDQGGNVNTYMKPSYNASIQYSGNWNDYNYQSTRNGVANYYLRSPSNASLYAMVYDRDNFEVLYSEFLNPNTTRYIEFFIKKNQRYQVYLQGFGGTGRYEFFENGFTNARRYNPEDFNVLKNTNSYFKFYNDLPAAKGYAITWSRSGDANRDLTLYTSTTGGGFQIDDTSVGFKYINTSGQGLVDLWVYDLTFGSNFSNTNDAKNVYTLWQVGGY